jgi:predicted TIM-barrel fold metal-dependent hydrolase
LEIPPDDFVEFVPERYRDLAPRRIRNVDGGDSWLIEGVPLVHTGANLTAGERIKPRGKSYWKEDGSRATGAGDSAQRLREQDLDGVDAEVLFPPIFVKGALAGITDPKAYEAIVEGYNTFLAEKYCAVAPDRLIATGVIPERGLQGAIRELRHCSELGLKAVALTSFPNGGTLASPDDDAFWAAALELSMPVTGHTHFGAPYPPYVNGPQPGSSADAGWLTTRQASQRPMWTVAQLIMTGVFDRFPQLQLYFAETNASWLPNALQQFDENYKTYEHMVTTKLDKLPSEYIRQHVWFGMIMDAVVFKMLDLMPVGNLMWGSDFPHSVGSFPHSQEWLEASFEGIDPQLKQTILVDSPVRFFHLDQNIDLTPTSP